MSDNSKFDFEALFKQFDPTHMAKQFQQLMATSPFSNFDSADLVETQRKTLESIKQANEAAVAGAQSLMERQSEMMQQAMTDAAEAMNNIAATEPAEVVSEHAAQIEAAVKKSMENFAEIGGMIQGIYAEISEQVEHRMDQTAEEMNDALAKTNTKAKAETKAKPETKAKAETKAKPETKATAETKAKPETKAKKS